MHMHMHMQEHESAAEYGKCRANEQVRSARSGPTRRAGRVYGRRAANSSPGN
jgi:hypothetical protein